MDFNKKNIAIIGIVLVLAIVLAGFLFSPSGFSTLGTQPDFVCVKIDSSTEICDGADSYWEDNTFRNLQTCENAHDELGRNCEHYHCDCRAAE